MTRLERLLTMEKLVRYAMPEVGRASVVHTLTKFELELAQQLHSGDNLNLQIEAGAFGSEHYIFSPTYLTNNFLQSVIRDIEGEKYMESRSRRAQEEAEGRIKELGQMRARISNRYLEEAIF